MGILSNVNVVNKIQKRRMTLSDMVALSSTSQQQRIITLIDMILGTLSLDLGNSLLKEIDAKDNTLQTNIIPCRY